jgi:hypothetical protein
MLLSKIENFLSLIRFKKLTPKQISTLFNIILQPSLEYLLQILSISKTQQQKLSRLLSITTKKMLHLAKNTSNIFLTNSLSFKLPTLQHLTQKVAISTIEHIFHSTLLLKHIGEARIKNWLTKIWQPLFLPNTPSKFSQKTKNFSFIFQLSFLNNSNIYFSLNNSLNTSSINIPTTTKTIYDILPSNTSSSLTKSLQNNKILFVEQLTTANNLYLLPWNNIYI